MSTLKNSLNEMVLLSTQNICKEIITILWSKFFSSGPMICLHCLYGIFKIFGGEGALLPLCLLAVNLSSADDLCKQFGPRS